jgi:hypothetical protein
MRRCIKAAPVLVALRGIALNMADGEGEASDTDGAGEGSLLRDPPSRGSATTLPNVSAIGPLVDLGVETGVAS